MESRERPCLAPKQPVKQVSEAVAVAPTGADERCTQPAPLGSFASI